MATFNAHGCRCYPGKGVIMAVNVALRKVQEADLAAFYEQQLDPEATSMAGFPARDYEAFMAHWKKCMADESTVLKTVLFESRVAGNIVSWMQAGEVNVGYWLGREFWGKSVATTALSLFINQVTKRPLNAHVARNNLPSIRVLEKCGFVSRVDSPKVDEESEILMTLH